MKQNKLYIPILLALLAAIVFASGALADTILDTFGDGIIEGGDDGAILRRNISKTPDGETEGALLSIMPFYIPAQDSNGSSVAIEYVIEGDETAIETREYAKPLVISYIDEEDGNNEVDDESSSIASGIGFGHRDAYVAISLDDGETWKRANLSNSAHLSSFTLDNGAEYPGDVYAMVHAVAGNRILAAWLSRYCSGGTPLYAPDSFDIQALKDEYGLSSLYLEDLFGVAGTQKSVDYTSQGFPEVGEVPFGCVWTARGTLQEVTNDDGTTTYEVAWTKAERLTSGRRDPNRLEIAGAKDAGFVIAWQEDPEGLRPGTGLGPGEGWSGAIVNAKTDVWYSYIGWNHFPQVVETDEDTIAKVGVPIAMPIRLTDNNMCKDKNSDPYCYYDFVNNANPGETGFESSTFCADSVPWENPGGTILNVCVSQDERVLVGRVGSSRPRISLHPYKKADGTTSAWFIMGYEESKALGEGTSEEETEVDPVDMGKNLWYHTFDMFNPEVVSHGNILNQPSKDPNPDSDYYNDFFPLLNTADLINWVGASGVDYNYSFYETEITRRFSLISQPASLAGPSGVVAVTLIKQGMINQGGPADIFIQRFAIPAGFNAASDNPYAYENMICDQWDFVPVGDPRWTSAVPHPEYNPFYPKGVCLADPTNLSGTEIVACENDFCPVPMPDEETIDIFPRVTEWKMTEETLKTQSWHNPYDISKGHRGFIDGDFLMVLYAWSPNWKMNSVGNDHYNLYVRRSFDGGQTWTTTPASLGGDGTTTCENYGIGGDVTTVCTAYEAGDFEQARNVSQLIGNRETILDPRYTPTPASILTNGSFLYPDDERNPSIFFLVYETGDNTTVLEGEAIPLDLFYSRATNWGDDYDVVEYCTSTLESGCTYGWDWLENSDPESGEASLRTNPGGTFFYATWSEALEIGEEEFTDMDAYFRRVMYNNTDVSPLAMILSPTQPAVSQANMLYFAGSARDRDHLGEGIIAYQWQSDIDGLLNTEKAFTMPASELSPGIHIITFTAQDGEGNWATKHAITLFVAKDLYQSYIPLIP